MQDPYLEAFWVWVEAQLEFETLYHAALERALEGHLPLVKVNPLQARRYQHCRARPMTRQSGQWRGKAFFQGGRKHLRDALYMPALVVMRLNPDLRQKYQAMKATGKPARASRQNQ